MGQIWPTNNKPELNLKPVCHTHEPDLAHTQQARTDTKTGLIWPIWPLPLPDLSHMCQIKSGSVCYMECLVDAIHIVDHVNHVDKLRVMILFYDTDPFYFFERKLKYSQSFV